MMEECVRDDVMERADDGGSLVSVVAFQFFWAYRSIWCDRAIKMGINYPSDRNLKIISRRGG